MFITLLFQVSRNGKAVTYRFFLFSDNLLYAHLSLKKEYVVHEQLSLTALQVSDVEGDASCCSFYLSHPVKSFVVVTDSPHNKALWIRDIKHAIDTCKKRETMANTGPLNRRISMITRLVKCCLKYIHKFL
ncbi:hypothetical protein EON64_15820 [archaeon]|nr:MAG: hypothetical protein EON64_15820 [archaeon]